MNILDKIKTWLPVSQRTLDVAIQEVITAEREQKASALRMQKAEFERERAKLTAKVDDLVYKLSGIRWHPEQWGGFAMQMHISPEMMRLTYDEDHRRMIAESLGHRVAAEVRASKFIQ